MRLAVIRSFIHPGLNELWSKKTSAKIDKKMHGRILRRLDMLDVANLPNDIGLPGFNFHSLRGKPQRYSVHVNGPWCLTFKFEAGDAWRVDFEKYH